MHHARHAVNPRAVLLRGDQPAQCEVEDGALGFPACGALARSRSAIATAAEVRLPSAVDCIKLSTSINAAAYAECPGQWSVRCPAKRCGYAGRWIPNDRNRVPATPECNIKGTLLNEFVWKCPKTAGKGKVAFLPERKLGCSRGWNSRASLEIKSVAVCRGAHGPATRRSLAFPGLGHPPIPVAT